MALTWEWKEKCGEITLEQKRSNGEWKQFPISLYRGNAYLIMIHEFTNDEGVEQYELFSFFVDKEHAKNCLGISKSRKTRDKTCQNIYLSDTERFSKLRINKAKYTSAAELVSMFVKAFDNIVIEVYSE